MPKSESLHKLYRLTDSSEKKPAFYRRRSGRCPQSDALRLRPPEAPARLQQVSGSAAAKAPNLGETPEANKANSIGQCKGRIAGGLHLRPPPLPPPSLHLATVPRPSSHAPFLSSSNLTCPGEHYSNGSEDAKKTESKKGSQFVFCYFIFAFCHSVVGRAVQLSLVD